MVCGVAWQGVANSARQRNEVSVASICRQNNTRRHGKFALTSVAIQQIQHGKNGRCLWAKQAQRKWGSVWAGDFSLSLSLSLSLLALFGILTFLNTLFLGFLRLSLRAVFAKTAWQSINLALFLLFGLPRSLCSLAMTARHKFKFFTQNLRHFVNSTHFINLTQILSPTQGFFIFLPQVFAQCKLIKNFLQGGHCV